MNAQPPIAAPSTVPLASPESLPLPRPGVTAATRASTGARNPFEREREESPRVRRAARAVRYAAADFFFDG